MTTWGLEAGRSFVYDSVKIYMVIELKCSPLIGPRAIREGQFQACRVSRGPAGTSLQTPWGQWLAAWLCR